MTAPRNPVVTLLPGDGIGPEVVGVTVRAIDALGVEIEWERHAIGVSALESHGTTLPEDVLESIRRNGVALKGPTGTPVGGGHVSVNVGLRRALRLHANLRPIRNIPGVSSRYSGVDLYIVRENTEGLYTGLEHVVVPGVVESLRVVTDEASTRIAEFAFRFAERRGRRKVTAVHKANILKLSDGLFLECCRRVAQDFPHIEYEELIVDNACMQLVTDPTRYDVMVSENLFGDILSDLGAELVGGMGLAASANLHPGRVSLFEPVHGSAPPLAGQGVANPMAAILSGALMLEHLGLRRAAGALEAGVRDAIEAGVTTPDLGGERATDDVAAWIGAHLRRS